MSDHDPTPAPPLTALQRTAAERDQYQRYYRHELARAERFLGELAQAQEERDQLLAQRDALKARLAWAEDALGTVWRALKEVR